MDAPVSDALTLSAARSVEQIDDRLRRAREIVQRAKECRRWERLSYGERYLRGNLNIGLRCVDFGPPYYGAILEAFPNPADANPSVVGGFADSRVDGQHIRRDESPVLPHVIECVEIKQVRVPARPRLQTFDNLLVGGGQQTYLFLSRVFPLKERDAAPADGELSTFWIRSASALGK